MAWLKNAKGATIVVLSVFSELQEGMKVSNSLRDGDKSMMLYQYAISNIQIACDLPCVKITYLVNSKHVVGSAGLFPIPPVD